MTTYKGHSTALKLQLVHAYMNGEGSCKQLAARHNINYALVFLWVQIFQRGEITEEQDQTEKVAEYEATIAALERKVGQLTMEVDLLKKGYVTYKGFLTFFKQISTIVESHSD